MIFSHYFQFHYDAIFTVRFKNIFGCGWGLGGGVGYSDRNGCQEYYHIIDKLVRYLLM